MSLANTVARHSLAKTALLHTYFNSPAITDPFLGSYNPASLLCSHPTGMVRGGGMEALMSSPIN